MSILQSERQVPWRHVRNNVLVMHHAPDVAALDGILDHVRPHIVTHPRTFQGVHHADVQGIVEHLEHGKVQHGGTKRVTHEIQWLVVTPHGRDVAAHLVAHGLPTMQETLEHLATLVLATSPVVRLVQKFSVEVPVPCRPVDCNEASLGLKHSADADDALCVRIFDQTQVVGVDLRAEGDGVADVPTVEPFLTTVNGLLKVCHLQCEIWVECCGMG
mmetsp:Transcript_37424/g.99465  ORF Transcript_37424/g.99465 Transcript_37424/m.99465 type:complete len:216 (-) Transcript_37424:80-727(-)